MFISAKLIARYQQTYQRKYGQTVTTKEAEQHLSDLSTLLRQIKASRSARHGK